MFDKWQNETTRLRLAVGKPHLERAEILEPFQGVHVVLEVMFGTKVAYEWR